MKKITLLSIVLLIFFTTVYAKNYDVIFSQPNSNEYRLTFQITEWNLSSVQFDGINYQQIVFDHSAVTNQKGWAELPFINTSVQLPAQKNMDLSVIITDYTDYPLDFPLLPSRGSIYRNQDPSTIPYQIAPASLVDRFYPDELAVAEEPYIIRDVRGTTVSVFPFQYNAATKTLRVYTKIEVALTENDEPATNPLLVENPNPIREVRGMYKSIFINYEESRVPLVMAEYGDILVVTTARDETAIQPYIDWKKEKGYNVKKVVVATGTNVKTTIKTEHTANPNLMYVLLVGAWADIKSDTFTATCDGVSSSCPTDPMLGDVTGTATDYRPDIAVGRMSASSAAQVTIQVNKTIQYEKNPNMEAAWYPTFIGIASNEGAGQGDDGEADYTHIQRIYEQRLQPKLNYNVHRRLYQNETGCTKANLISYINSGATTIAYCGHGSSTSFVTTGLNNTDVNGLTNGQKMPFIVSVACAEGAIQKTTCFAEAWLRKDNGGAIATWMATMDQPWQPPMRGQDYFYDILIGGFNYSSYPGQSGLTTEEQRTHWGAIAVNAANLMLSQVNQTDDKNTVRTWTTFGDPSLQLRTKLPDMITSSTNSFTQGNAYTTTITKSGTPMKDALVCISQNGVYHHAFTNTNGVVTIANSFTTGNNIRLVVTAFNTTTIYTMIECVAGGPQLCEKPVEVSGSANGNNATITWNQPVNIDGTLTGYNVYRGDVKIGETLPTEKQYTDAGLTNGTYIYKVSAKYQHCPESELSDGTTVVIFVPQYCEPPVNLTANTFDCGITLYWNTPEHIDGTLLYYEVILNGVAVPEVVTDTTKIFPLPEGTYTFHVRAHYEHCVSALSEGKTVELVCGPQLCEPPCCFYAEVAYKNTAVMAWNDPINQDGNLTGYNIYRNGILLTQTGWLVKVYFDENLPNGTYTYQISAKYEHCPESELSEEKTVVIFIPQLCEMPVNLSGKAEDKDAVISWNLPENVDGVLLGYNIYRDGTQIAETDTLVVGYRDENLDNGTYIYQISAKYEHCPESELTDSVSVTILTEGINGFLSNSINIYPNPASNELHVTSYTLHVTDIEVFDVYGRKVEIPHFVRNDVIPSVAQRNAESRTISISHLPAGVYFVKIYTKENQITIKKLIINN